MSATDELRRMLDERGVEWMPVAWNPKRETFYHAANGVGFCADEYTDGVKIYTDTTITPAQAIAATLGSEREAELQKALNKAAGNWAMADNELREALDFMRIWISEDAHLGESELSAAFEKSEGLRKFDAIESAIAATLRAGTCRNVDADPGWFSCSECGCICSVDWYGFGFGTPNFCPNCGRKVEEG